jgi:hypothetical protein
MGKTAMNLAADAAARTVVDHLRMIVLVVRSCPA